MLKRFLNLIKSWFGIGLDKLENPDLLLKQAQDEMREVHARNRERAIQALTQKNNLQNMVNDLQKQVDTLAARAELALKRGDRDTALQLLKEKQAIDGSLVTTKQTLETAIQTSEAVKEAIKREEDQIRKKTAEALALKAQWKNAQIQIEMDKALSSMGQLEDVDSAFGRASEKIKNAISESSARAELAKGRIDSRIAALEATETDAAAEQELAALEGRLGLSSTTATTTTTTATGSDIEEELARLEARVGGGGSAS
jgi:phage shock protein A